MCNNVHVGCSVITSFGSRCFILLFCLLRSAVLRTVLSLWHIHIYKSYLLTYLVITIDANFINIREVSSTTSSSDATCV